MTRPDLPAGEPLGEGGLLRERVARSVMRWAQRHATRRLREEWSAYQGNSELKTRWFRRDATLPRTQNFRSLFQVNFYRAPRR